MIGQAHARTPGELASYNFGYYIGGPLILILIGMILGFIFKKKVNGKKIFNLVPLYICLFLVVLMIFGFANRAMQERKLDNDLVEARFSKLAFIYGAGLMAIGRPAQTDEGSLLLFDERIRDLIGKNPSMYGVEKNEEASIKFSHSLMKVDGNKQDIIRVDALINDNITAVHFAGYRKELRSEEEKLGSELDVVCIAKKPVIFKYEGGECEVAVKKAFSTVHFDWQS